MSILGEYRNETGESLKTKPLFRWVGGKTRAITQLLPLVPTEFDTYREPFVGGGSLFFALASDVTIRSGAGLGPASLNDTNTDLVAFYRAVRDDLEELLAKYSDLATAYLEHRAQTFETIRASEPNDKIDRAARFLYLTRAAFSGLWRVNRKGQFNAPIGDRLDVSLSHSDIDNLRAARRALGGAAIASKDFTVSMGGAGRGDLVYLDPPYLDNYSGYTKGKFGKDEHALLAEHAHRAFSCGAMVVISAADSEFYRGQLYADWDITEHVVRRSVSRDPAKRGNVKELVIRSPNLSGFVRK